MAIVAMSNDHNGSLPPLETSDPEFDEPATLSRDSVTSGSGADPFDTPGNVGRDRVAKGDESS